ncbi:AAA family ATPase [Draconibacterium sp. IB214405]|uniref:AAA family ATPase n=1 Tax=Draconibacterium sp. IB214405 TaxID=3097352 RepID=UPI002A0E2248|nr:AAA family ATPase [Draconibacterium sp. IB214405]MDX8340546.1 AAA family ATPase [Draconibacterium sp. IB214405]
MIDYVKIAGYKSIKEINLDIKPINIIIGANGSGKSNFISFFEFLNQVYQQNLAEYIALRGGEEKILHKGAKITSELKFEISFNNELNGYSATLHLGESGFVFMNEYLLFRGDKGWDISTKRNEAYIKRTDNYRAKYVIRFLKGFRKYHFHDTSKNSPFKQLSHIENDSYFLYEEGKNLAAYLYSIKEDSKIIYNRIIKTIQSIAPFFSDFYFQPNKEGYLKLQWQDKYSSNIYGANDFSDGTLRFIALTTLFMQPQLPDTIIIDEPELGLHPTAITKLSGMIKSVAAKGTQVILATQSADLVNHFEPEDVITVNQQNGESLFNRLSSKELEHWLDEYSLGDLWQRNILKGGQPE